MNYHPALKCLPPEWVIPRASFDMDFKKKRSWGGRIVTDAWDSRYTDHLVQGASGGATTTAPDAFGVLHTFGPYAARITEGMGLWAEIDNTNYCLWSRDFSNALWVKNNVTATKNQVDAGLNINGAYSLTATQANATIIQTLVMSSAAAINSCYIKALVVTGIIWMTMDNGATWVDITAQITAGWTQAFHPYQTLANPQVGLKFQNANDSVAVDYWQTETQFNGTSNLTILLNPTQPLPTTNATSRRYSDEPVIGYLAQPMDSQRIIHDIICSGAPYWVYAESQATPTSTGFIIVSDAGITMKGGSNGAAASFTGATGSTGATSGNLGVNGMGNINKVFGMAYGGGNAVCLNGGPVVFGGGNSAFNTSAGTHCGLGNNGQGACYLGGPMGRIAFGKGEVSTALMQKWTE